MTKARFARFASFILLLALFVSPAVTTSAGGGKAEKPESAKKAARDVTARKTDHALQAALNDDPAGTIRVIMRVKKGWTDSVVATVQSLGGQVVGSLSKGKSMVAEVHNADVDDLANHPGIQRLSIDGNVKANDFHFASEPVITQDFLRAVVGVPFNGPTGRGVRIAIVDSGIANLPDFDHQIKAFYDFTNGGKKVAPFDDYGHGTHIAGLIGSDGSQTKGRFAGMAPDVTFIGLKVLDATGNGRTSDVIAAIEFATANKGKLAIDILNLSLGHPIFESASTDPLVQAVEKAVQAGIVVVVSAGNRGMDPETNEVTYAGIESPGNAPSVITVGATMTSGTIARGDDLVVEYSARGPTWFDGLAKPDIVAPGQRLVSDSPDGVIYKQNQSWRFARPAGASGRFIRLSGTSMSTGVVSGIAALVLEANRTTPNADGTPKAPLTPYDVKAILEYTATGLAGADELSQGAGEINADGAIALTKAIDTRWTPWAVASLTPETTIGGETLPWARALIWRRHRLASSTPDDLVSLAHLFWMNRLKWGADLESADGTHVVWGNDTVAANLNHVVWGNDILQANLRHIVWGNDVVEANRRHIVWGNDDVTANRRHVVWGNRRHVVWGNSCSVAEICY